MTSRPFTPRPLVLLACLAAALPAAAQVAAPVLKWQHGGCYASWCETGWYSSPAVADLDGDGTPEVVASAYSIVALEGATGALEWRVASGHDRSEPAASSVGRTWPGIVIADVDDDGALEIVTAHGGGWASVYDAAGYFEPGWPRQPVANELRSLTVADLDGDGPLEVVVGAARSDPVNTWVLEHDGSTRPGWPQLVGTGYAWGVYNDNIAAGELDGDPGLELVVPSDVNYVCSYQPDGSQRVADLAYGGKTWCEVGVWESYATELLGFGLCNGIRAQSYRTNFAHGPATVADLDADGDPEVVLTGRTYDCSGGTETDKYTGVYVFEPDRGRYVNPPYDWTSVPQDLGAPLSLDYQVIEHPNYNPVVADLDGDGEREIVFADFSGRVHAFWLDKTERGSWPYRVWTPEVGHYRYASEPAIADLDGDGDAEVLFTTWTQKGSNANGSLYVLSATGTLLHQVPLPAARASGLSWNGALAAPTLADLDGDPDLEVVIQTAFSGVVAYDLPGTANARVHWATGRGSLQRSGTSAAPCTAEETETVANETIANETRTIEACERVTLGPNLILESGADVTIRTSGIVEFVPPVEVREGAELTVVNAPAD